MCRFHYSQSKGTPTKKYKIQQQTKKNKEKKRNKTQLMRPFWEYHLDNMQRTNAVCENCGCKITKGIVNIAHIIPKSSHICVMDDLNNVMYLCASIENNIGCHDKYDRIQNTPQVYLMPVFVKAVERYKLFRDKIDKYSKQVAIFEQWI
jgi:hypothetical protein